MDRFIIASDCTIQCFARSWDHVSYRLSGVETTPVSGRVLYHWPRKTLQGDHVERNEGMYDLISGICGFFVVQELWWYATFCRALLWSAKSLFIFGRATSVERFPKHLWSNPGMVIWSHDWANSSHYGDVIMGAIAYQITSLTTVYPTIYSDSDQRKHQSTASLAFVRGIHRGPVNFPHKWPVTRKIFSFDDVIMWNVIKRKQWTIKLPLVVVVGYNCGNF